MRLALMAERKPLCKTCIKMKGLPKSYLGKPGQRCDMCWSMIYPKELEFRDLGDKE